MKIAFVYLLKGFSIPLGMGYMSASLKNHGFNTRFFNLKNFEDEQCLNDLAEYQPDVVAYTVISGQQQEYTSFNRRVKQRLENVKSVFGGPHPTFFPEMVEKEGIDAICVGEGEVAFCEFMIQFREKNALPQSIPNFWIKTENGISKSDVLPKNQEMDALPFPDREEFFKANPLVRDFGIKQFMAHKGCPYLCTFCFNDSYNEIYSEDKIVMSRDPKLLCDEIVEVKDRYPMQIAMFVDDVFTIDKQWTIDFCEEYSARVNLPWYCNIRLDNTNEKVVKAMSEAKCVMLMVGAESGDDFIRNTIMKRNMEIPYMLEKLKMLKKYGIKVLTENIIGSPGETFEMALKTLELNKIIKPAFGNCSIFTPYPKLGLTNYAIKHGYFDGDFDKIKENYFDTSILKFKNPEDKNRIINLRFFFSTIIAFPILEKPFIFLTRFKVNPFFSFYGQLADGYFLFRTTPFSFSILHLIKTTFSFLMRRR